MKKLALIFGIALALSTTAGAADIAFYVGTPNTDGWYDVATETKDVDMIVAQTGHLFKDIQRFDDAHLKEFGAWVDKNTNDGEVDIIWLNGCVPSVLYPIGNTSPDGSRIEKWLDDGNMIINVGDWFGYITYETGSRSGTENGSAGAADILDLSSGIIVSADNTSLTLTPAGKEYLPSLKDPVITYRPIVPSAVVAPWEVAAVFAANASGSYADPIVIHNTKTGAYVAFINQCAGGTTVWIDRGQASAEFIENWVNEVVGLGPQPFARGPNPKNDSMIDQTKVQASWRAGDYAKLHDVYFGESFDQVSAATPADAGVYVGRQVGNQLPMGMTGGVIPSGLIPGKTYYWRVDEINAADPASPWRGTVWSFTIRPQTAFKPFPPNGMRYIDPNQDLSWDTGMAAIFHTVYFGQTFDEVNTPTVGGMMVASGSLDPGTLALDTTYYWRVDEFAFPPGVTYAGPVWSFTTRGTGGGAKAQYFSGMALAGAPVLTRIEGTINVNSAGEVVAGLSDNLSARWTANLEAPFTETYNIITSSDDGVRLWFDGRLVIDNWTDHGTTDNTASVNLIGGQVYSVVMEWYENAGGAVAQLSWSSPTLARQIIPQGWLQLPVRATGPYPANAAVDVSQAPILRWIAGDQAASQELYFGEDKDAVTTGTTPTASLGADETTYDPGTLERGKTYYWRVDEVNAAEADSPWKGVPWSFTTANFLIVDDFETYTDEVGHRVFQTWLDGFGYTDPEEVPGNGTNATVGNLNPPFAEQTIVHTGFQAMPMDYNNVIDPFYSEAERTWSAPQNWTGSGMNTLVLFIRGVADNGADQLYVALQDNAGHVGVAGNPDTAVVKATKWVEWEIPLSQFTGVSMTSIKKMYIGVGDRKSPKAGGAGRLYIDDIRVIQSE